MVNDTGQRLYVVGSVDGEIFFDVQEGESINVRSIAQTQSDKYFSPQVKINIKGRFLKVMDKEKELIETLKKYPSTYMAIHIMAKYLSQSNLIIKNGKKFKQKDLAEELGITRQMVSIHINRLKEMNVIAEVPTNRGNYWAINPDYFCRSDTIPQIVYDTFHKKINL